MIHSQNTQAPREELTAAIIDAKIRKDLSWQELTDGTGLSLAFRHRRPARPASVA
jgi:cyanate lyase